MIHECIIKTYIQDESFSTKLINFDVQLCCLSMKRSAYCLGESHFNYYYGQRVFSCCAKTIIEDVFPQHYIHRLSLAASNIILYIYIHTHLSTNGYRFMVY